MNFDQQNDQPLSWKRPKTKKRKGASVRKKIEWSKIFSRFVNFLRFWSSLTLIFIILSVPYFSYQYILENNPFPIKHVNFVGQLTHLSPKDIQKFSKYAFDQNFLIFNLSKFQEHLKQEPWFYSLSLKRQWPDTIVIEFKEQTPIARWGADELLNDKGERFRPNKLLNDDFLIYLHGPDGQEKEVIDTYQKMQAQLSKIKLNITAIQMDARRSWTLTLNNQLQLLLGTDNIEARLNNFIEYYPQKIASQIKDIKSVDLRYNNGFAIKWRLILPESHIDSVALNMQKFY